MFLKVSEENWFFNSMFLFTINGHPEDEEGHAVEFSTPPDGESEPTLASRELHGKVLVVLGQMGVDLLVLLKRLSGQTIVRWTRTASGILQ